MTVSLRAPISSWKRLGTMSEIPCAFDGNLYRVDICQGIAVAFFKTAKGTVWPLCTACSDRHKEMMAQLVAKQHIDINTAVGAVFDIPLTDAATLQAFQEQDPQRVQRIIAMADDMFLGRKS